MENDKKIKVLLVDDDEAIRTMYAEILSGAGFLVEEADDGINGLEKASKSAPDLIFTGIEMPRMDGFALIESLRKNPETANIPILMSSHRGKKEDEAKAKEMGVKEFIVYMTVTPKQVIEKMMGVLKKAYLLKFDPDALDAQKLAADLNIDGKHYQCHKCGRNLVVSLQVLDAENHEFGAKFICPSCK